MVKHCRCIFRSRPQNIELTPRPSDPTAATMFSVGLSELDARLWTHDCGTHDCGRTTVDARLWTHDCGRTTVDARLWTTVDARLWTHDCAHTVDCGRHGRLPAVETLRTVDAAGRRLWTHDCGRRTAVTTCGRTTVWNATTVDCMVCELYVCSGSQCTGRFYPKLLFRLDTVKESVSLPGSCVRGKGERVKQIFLQTSDLLQTLHEKTNGRFRLR
ncbi:hypothetical protein WMY93_020888 [Mugilogobius chulae]|uniref:Uncharacterized protein n=1 Tax=Mugilogobius chulae TaxID=88201 RepID=A0AAW0NLC8_9GOBI